MESDSIIKGVDYQSVEAIQRKRVLKFVNHFVVQMAAFLSNFSQTCDFKLMSVSRKIDNLETSLALLEHKLDSVPQLKPEKVEETEKIETENDDKMEEEENSDFLAKNPQLSMFVKMLNVGVPEQAVRLKMKSQGLDEVLLDQFFLTVKT